MLTFQDFEAEADKVKFITRAVSEYMASDDYIMAGYADDYDAQRNTTICNTVKTLYSSGGKRLPDYTAANNRIASNFFHRLNIQRTNYSLGNGVTFTNDGVKDRFTDDFDTILKKAGMTALEHGTAYIMINDAGGGKYKIHRFTKREFVPLYDESDGRLRAGIRFWSLDWRKKPATIVLYEEDGYTTFRSKQGTTGLATLEQDGEKRAYKLIVRNTEASGEQVVGEENYGGRLPIVPLYGNDRHESTLVGLRSLIDSYDLIMSGFANDLQDCAQVYWLIGNAMGMSDADVEQFRDRLKFMHMAVADLNESNVTPYTQDIPHAARTIALQMLEDAIYTGFGGFSVKNVAASAKTATEINAAYQPMDEEADDYEYQIIQAVQQILALIGVEDTPVFKRNRIANQSEQVQMLVSVAQYLDDETILKNIPFISVDEIEQILTNKYQESQDRLNEGEPPNEMVM